LFMGIGDAGKDRAAMKGEVQSDSPIGTPGAFALSAKKVGRGAGRGGGMSNIILLGTDFLPGNGKNKELFDAKDSKVFLEGRGKTGGEEKKVVGGRIEQIEWKLGDSRSMVKGGRGGRGKY